MYQIVAYKQGFAPTVKPLLRSNAVDDRGAFLFQHARDVEGDALSIGNAEYEKSLAA